MNALAWRRVPILMAACLLAGCADPAAQLNRDLARLHLQGLTYGETYRELAKLGFDCGAYQQERYSLDARTMTCTRKIARPLRCDLIQFVYVQQAEVSWRTERVSTNSGPVCW